MQFRSNKLIPLIILILFIAGCENPFSANEIQLDSSELEQFSNDLEIELGLSGKNTNTLRKALGRHGGKGRWGKDPGFLWKLAAELQGTLSDEAKEKIFSRLNNTKEYSKNRMDRGPKDLNMGKKDPFEAIQKILTEDQKKEFDSIISDHRTEISSIFEAVQSGAITRQEGDNTIKKLEESLRNSIDALLTDEQKAQLDEMKKEVGAKKKAFAEQVKLAKMEALALTNDQIYALDEAKEKMENELANIKTRAESGELIREEARIATEIILEANKEALFNIFTDKQVEIIKIHRFLKMRWHSKRGNRDDEDKHGGRGG